MNSQFVEKGEDVKVNRKRICGRNSHNNSLFTMRNVFDVCLVSTNNSNKPQISHGSLARSPIDIAVVR